MQLPTRIIVLAIGLSMLLFCGCGKRAQQPKTLLIFTPCGMEMPFDDIAKLFEERHPGLDVVIELDAAHLVSQRVIDGAKPDLVVSPGGVEMEPLIEYGLVDPEKLVRFGAYDLMLFVPRANAAGVKTVQDLTADEVKTVAIANPDKTSIGRYAKEALVKLGLWEQIKGKVVVTADASQTYKQVARAKADASFAYRSCPLKTAPDKLQYSKVRVLEEVPKDLYGTAWATAAVPKNAPHPDLADAFAKFLVSPEGQGIFREYDLPTLDDKK